MQCPLFNPFLSDRFDLLVCETFTQFNPIKYNVGGVLITFDENLRKITLTGKLKDAVLLLAIGSRTISEKTFESDFIKIQINSTDVKIDLNDQHDPVIVFKLFLNNVILTKNDNITLFIVYGSNLDEIDDFKFQQNSIFFIVSGSNHELHNYEKEYDRRKRNV
jgi:hypothetical protein